MTTSLQFTELWPTKLIKRRLPDYASRNPALESLIGATDRQQSNVTERFLEQNFFDREEDCIRWLKAQIDETASSYLRHVGVKYRVEWVVHGWYNINQFGDHHAPHSHPAVILERHLLCSGTNGH